MKTLIYFKPDYAKLAIKLRDNYRTHNHGEVDIVSEEEHDDIEYAIKMRYDEAVFIENSDEYVAGNIAKTVEVGPGENLDVTLDSGKYVLQLTTVGQSEGAVEINIK